jgi:hypothetical protein
MAAATIELACGRPDAMDHAMVAVAGMVAGITAQRPMASQVTGQLISRVRS